MHMRFSLTKLNLLLVIASFLLFMVLLAGLLAFGLDGLMESWHEQELTSLNRYITTRLEEVGQSNGPDTEETLQQAFEGLPYSPTYLTITDALGRVLYTYRTAERGMGRARGLQMGLSEPEHWQTVLASDGSVAFRYSTHLPSFAEMEGNGYFLSAAWQVLLISFLVAFLSAVVLAFFVLYPLKRQSETLASALKRIANGERNVSFSKQKVLEFETIADASLVLQHTLSKEERLRSQWTADIAHDLRTPVTVLKGQLEAIADGVFTADRKRLDLLLGETARLENLIQSLSLLTRLESPDFKVDATRFSLSDLLAQLQARFEAEAAKRGMCLGIPSTQAFVVADSMLLTRALDNLISNAIRYGKADSTIAITFETDEQDQATWLCIENEGTIDHAFLPHVFDRLSRSEHSRSTQGSGLGLSIVKAIVEAHQWTIQAESNQTTKFVIRFT